MRFTVKKHSDIRFEEKREIPSLEKLMELMAEHRCEIRLSPNGLLDRDPVIWICDSQKLV